MYADRHAGPEGIKPGSLAIAIGINGALVGALMFASPAIEMIKKSKPLELINVLPEPAPPPPNIPELKPQPDAKQTVQREQVSSTKPIADTGASDYVLPDLPPPPFRPDVALGEITRIDTPVAPPVLTDAAVDQRFVRYLQPEYPAGERRAEREGFATVRVTIGADGRVSAAECVSATSDAFCNVTKAQALAKWRFTPATRDGVAVGAGKTMTVRFKLEQ